MNTTKALGRMALAGLAAACALLAGCGNIQVAVDVLDPGYVKQEMDEESLKKLYREIVAAEPGDITKRVDRQFRLFGEEVNRLTAKVRATALKLPESQQRDMNRAAQLLDDNVAPGGQFQLEASRNGDQLETLAQKVRDTGARLNVGGRGPLPAELRDLLADFKALAKKPGVEQVNNITTLKSNVETAVRNAVKEQAGRAAAAARAAAPAARAETAADAAAAQSTAATAAALAPSLSAVQQQAAAAVAASRRSVIQDGSLAATEFAYVVANAPEPLWKTDFNRAYASGTLGNVDIVIRMNSTADFSVKGLLFDASKVAMVASKVITQSVLLGAQMSGVPVPTASTGTTSGGDALSKSSADLASADVVLAKRQALLDAQKDAIRSLARSMLAGASQLGAAPLKDQKPADPDRAALQDGISSSANALRPLLLMQDFQ
jgi:hypothetical protein